jgi:hypothetical protein
MADERADEERRKADEERKARILADERRRGRNTISLVLRTSNFCQLMNYTIIPLTSFLVAENMILATILSKNIPQRC